MVEYLQDLDDQEKKPEPGTEALMGFLLSIWIITMLIDPLGWIW